MTTASLRVNNDLGCDALVALAVTAESVGFDQLWVSHDLFGRAAPVLLTVVARETTTLRLGVGVFNPYSQHPAEIAMTAATLQEVSAGRLLLGVGAGAEDFLGWAGIARPAPLRRTAEALVALRALLSGGRPADDPAAGSGWRGEGFLRVPAPAPPLYVGAMSPGMLALAGAMADGALPLLFPPEHFPVAAAQVRDGAAGAGRDPATLDLAACIWCSVNPDTERAEAALADKIAYYGPSFAPYLLARAGLSREDFAPVAAALAAGDPGRAARLVTEPMLRLGVAGDADALVRRCRGLLDAGATHLSFGPPLGPDPLEAVRVLGDQVLPRLRRR